MDENQTDCSGLHTLLQRGECASLANSIHEHSIPSYLPDPSNQLVRKASRARGRLNESPGLRLEFGAIQFVAQRLLPDHRGEYLTAVDLCVFEVLDKNTRRLGLPGANCARDDKDGGRLQASRAPQVEVGPCDFRPSVESKEA